VIVRLAAAEDLPAVFALRHQVFVGGQGVPEELERDELDAVSDHAVAVVDGVVVGTGRLLPDGTIGRMAVADAARRRGIGAAVLARLEQRARERGLPAVELHAQLHATGFYTRAGYLPFGEVYLEAGIEHRSMRKELLMSSTEVVQAFMKAAAVRDYDAAFALVTDDIEYQNMMLPAVHGKDAVRETLEGLLALCTDSEWVVHREVADGDLVMNERTDRFEINGVWTDLPVAGVFVLRDGRIALWRDYFDLQTIMTAMTPPAL
jgi:limonene-1,2-epoxide hydrolase/predicted GNAT family N-acyltransferase